MKILKTVKKIPGGLMVVPLLLGALINTLFPQALQIGGFTTNLFKSGAMPILAAFLFCNGAQINAKQAGSPLIKGVALTLSKFLIGAVLGVLVNKFFGPSGVLGIAPLAIIAAITNSNGGLYAALAGQYGDSTDVGAISILSLNDGPFFTMVAFGITGIANVPFIALVATIVPILIGFILGNLDEDLRKFLEPGTVILIPFFAFPLGAALNFGQIIQAGIPGIILGVVCTLLTGIGGYYTMKLLKAEHPQVGAAVGTTAGNAVATPAALAAVDASLAAVAPTATVQIAAAIIVTAILCPLFVNYLDKREKQKKLKTANAAA
ncbi:MAG: 2-keto-3-deoxygluconate permease [Bacillota bacterium]|nr:2-keto-3-deoxygluconate permease [Bacillota bacterium]